MIVIGDCPLCDACLRLEKDYAGTWSAVCVGGHRYFNRPGNTSMERFMAHIDAVAKVRKANKDGDDVIMMQIDNEFEGEIPEDNHFSGIVVGEKRQKTAEDVEVGKLIRETRLGKDITIRALAKEIDIKQSSLWQYEHGNYRPRREWVIEKIAELLDIPRERLWETVAK